MTEQKREIYGPEYLRNFACIMSSCEESCCTKWVINIDLKTYMKYKQLNDEEFKPILDECLTRNRLLDLTEDTQGYFKLGSNMACPLQDEKKLCRIQLKYGEDYLSKVCHTFPRVVNIVDGKIERSLTFSCPEVARLVLLNEKPIKFIKFEETANNRIVISTTFDTIKKTFIKKHKKYFYELRDFIIGLIQNRKYEISERLIYLGVFIKMLEDIVNMRRFNDIPALLYNFPELLKKQSFRESVLKIETIYEIQIFLLKELCESINSRNLIEHYTECFEEFKAGLGFNIEPLDENEIISRYKEAYKTYYSPFFDKHQYILENYLVNYIYKNLFPFMKGETLFNNYVIFIIHYAIIKFHLIGIAAYSKGLTIDKVVKLIFSFSKTFEHNPKYFVEVSRLMGINKYNNLTYMSILIKN